MSGPTPRPPVGPGPGGDTLGPRTTSVRLNVGFCRTVTVVQHQKETHMTAETYSGEFYCVKCKAKREAEGEVRVNDKGTRMAKAKCPVCGTNLNRILGKA